MNLPSPCYKTNLWTFKVLLQCRHTLTEHMNIKQCLNNEAKTFLTSLSHSQTMVVAPRIEEGFRKLPHSCHTNPAMNQNGTSQFKWNHCSELRRNLFFFKACHGLLKLGNSKACCVIAQGFISTFSHSQV